MQNKSGFQFLRNPKGRLVFWSGELGMASAPSGGRWWRQERPSPVHSHPTSESLSHQSREVSWLDASRIKEVAWSCTSTWSLSFPAHTKSGDVVIGCVSSKCKISLSTILVALGGKQISMGVSYIPTLTCLKLITKDHCEQSQINEIERLSHLPFETIEMKMVDLVKLVTSFMTTSKTRETGKLANKSGDVSLKAW